MSTSGSRRKIEFRFHVSKFADVLVYLAARVPDLTTLKATKLIYLADRAHLLDHARPITGDWYACMEHGPVPSEAYDVMKNLRGEEGWTPSGAEALRDRIQTDCSGQHVAFKASLDEPLENLSESELKVLERIVQEYGNKPIGALIDVTHGHQAWRHCRDHGLHQMDYRDFFAEEENKDVLELMEEEQEDRDFFEQLTA